MSEPTQHITELENRLRALWDKYDGDCKHYMERIKRLEEAGDVLHDGWRGNRNNKDKYLWAWHKAKEANPCIKQLKTKSCIYCMKVECECSDFDVSADMGAKG